MYHTTSPLVRLTIIVSYGNEHDIGAIWMKHYRAKPSTPMPAYQECSVHALVLLLAIIHDHMYGRSTKNVNKPRNEQFAWGGGEG